MGKLISFLIVIFSQLFSGQNIESSRKTVEKINQTQGFKIKIVPNSYFSDKNIVTDNGIELKGYYKNNKLLKMEYWVGLSAWKIITEYFFSDNAELVFVHLKKYQIIGENGYLKKPQFLSEWRCYYENDKVIKTIGEINNDEKKDYLKESQQLINDLKTYNNKCKINLDKKLKLISSKTLQHKNSPTYFPYLCQLNYHQCKSEELRL